MDAQIELPPNIEDIPPPGMGLVEELDKVLLVQLRDGRKLIGIMRSFDQFANIVLEGTCAVQVGRCPLVMATNVLFPRRADSSDVSRCLQTRARE